MTYPSVKVNKRESNHSFDFETCQVKLFDLLCEKLFRFAATAITVPRELSVRQAGMQPESPETLAAAVSLLRRSRDELADTKAS
jgi:hypothetical protein